MSNTTQPILPGAVIGILGSGQLGRMLALSARQMGYRVHTLSPDEDSPTGQVADREYVADYADLGTVGEFARGVSVVTLEFENIPADTVAAIEQHVPVRPGALSLYTAQHRLREKQFLARVGIPHAPFAEIHDAAGIAPAVEQINGPGILKTAGFGYDGKGQIRVRTVEDVSAAWTALDEQSCVLEGLVPFDFEFSVIGARGTDGEFAAFPPVHNTHRDSILDVSVAPAPNVDAAMARDATDIVRTVMEELGTVGVLCIEFFAVGRTLAVNEMAPRPHNSGHLTIEGCQTSQFEQQLRAVCCLPLGSTDMVQPAAAMSNLLGDVWPEQGEPDWPAALAMPGVALHIYGKSEPRAGRKMGHLSAVGSDADSVRRLVSQARSVLSKV